MNIDELKALRLRRSQLQAELGRIEALLNPGSTIRPNPANRAQFYKDAENDFRNCDSNGNYCAHDPGDEDPKAWKNEKEA